MLRASAGTPRLSSSCRTGPNSAVEPSPRRLLQFTGISPCSAICRSSSRARSSERRASDLEQQLARATAALHEAEQRHQAAMAATDRQVAELQSQYEIGMARAAATWEMVDEQLRTAALEVERARQEQAAAAADVDRLSRQLAEADAAVEAATRAPNKNGSPPPSSSPSNSASSQAQIAQEAERRRKRRRPARRSGQRTGRCGEAARVGDERTRLRNHASSKPRCAWPDRIWNRRPPTSSALTTREEEINARLAEVIGSRTDLERRLAATEAAFDEAVTRATRERLATSKKAAEREAELDGQLRRECAARATLEQTIAERETALRAAQQRHEAALAAAATELGERQAQFDRELTQHHRRSRSPRTAVERHRRRPRAGTATITSGRCRHRAPDRARSGAR